MKRVLLALMALAVLLVTGCGGGAPKAVTPEVKHDFGDVLTTAETMNKEFVIKNEGTGNLKLSDVQVKLLQGC